MADSSLDCDLRKLSKEDLALVRRLGPDQPDMIAEQVSAMAGPDTDLRKLSAEALKLVRAWAEDRLINAVTPLDIRLQLEQPGVLACDLT